MTSLELFAFLLYICSCALLAAALILKDARRPAR